MWLYHLRQVFSVLFWDQVEAHALKDYFRYFLTFLGINKLIYFFNSKEITYYKNIIKIETLSKFNATSPIQSSPYPQTLRANEAP